MKLLDKIKSYSHPPISLLDGSLIARAVESNLEKVLTLVLNNEFNEAKKLLNETSLLAEKMYHKEERELLERIERYKSALRGSRYFQKP